MRAKAHNNTGILYIRQSRYQEAIREFEQALSYHPNFPDALFNAGKLLVETRGDLKKANDFLQAALNQSRDPSRSQQIRKLLRKLKP